MKKKKLIQAMKTNPKNIRFEVLRNFLESIGYTADNNGGSHYVFTKEGAIPLTIPYRRPVKVFYVKKVIEIIEEDI